MKILRGISWYTIIASLSLIIRQNFLPTPASAMGLEVLNWSQLQSIFENPEVVFSLLPGIFGTFVNYLVESPLHLITFTIVGFMYERGDGAWKGSLLYLLVYLINIMFITACFYIGWLPWALGLSFVGYLIVLGVVGGFYVSVVQDF